MEHPLGGVLGRLEPEDRVIDQVARHGDSVEAGADPGPATLALPTLSCVLLPANPGCRALLVSRSDP